MNTYVVSDKQETKEDVPLLSANDYFFNLDFLSPNLTIINRCKSYAYQSTGYYVSLIALARGQKVSPSINEIVLGNI